MIARSRKEGIANLIQDITGLSFVWFYQGWKEGDDTFVSGRLVGVGGNRTSGDRVLRESDAPDEFEENIFNIDEYTLFLTCTGSGAYSALEELVPKLRLDKNRSVLRNDLGLAFITSTAVLDLTEQRGIKYTEKASVDLLIRTSSKVSGSIEIMESASVKEATL